MQNDKPSKDMLKLRVTRVVEYGKEKIYILHYTNLYTFAYLFYCKGQIHIQHTLLKPPLFRRILAKLHFIKSAYEEADFKEIEKAMINGAIKRIEELHSNKPIAIPANM